MEKKEEEKEKEQEEEKEEKQAVQKGSAFDAFGATSDERNLSRYRERDK